MKGGDGDAQKHNGEVPIASYCHLLGLVSPSWKELVHSSAWPEASRGDVVKIGCII